MTDDINFPLSAVTKCTWHNEFPNAASFIIDVVCEYLSAAVALQRRVCMVGLIRDDVGPLDVVYGFDPGQSRQLLIVQNITVSFGLRV